MLPFLKKNYVTGLVIAKRKPDGSASPEMPESDDGDMGMDSASEDLIKAIHSKDIKAVTAALKAAFEMHMSGYEDAEDLEESEEA